ncbi:MAG: hypothetical protein LIR46_02885 [Bacteroidota bacterium]|nr:hypothetical protein [Bacteroidota bacterium]
MIDWDKYDPAKDADEHENHFCNSLNATWGTLVHYVWGNKEEYVIIQKKIIETTCNYLERAQATINYLRHELEKAKNETSKETENNTTN